MPSTTTFTQSPNKKARPHVAQMHLERYPPQCRRNSSTCRVYANSTDCTVSRNVTMISTRLLLVPFGRRLHPNGPALQGPKTDHVLSSSPAFHTMPPRARGVKTVRDCKNRSRRTYILERLPLRVLLGKSSPNSPGAAATLPLPGTSFTYHWYETPPP